MGQPALPAGAAIDAARAPELLVGSDSAMERIIADVGTAERSIDVAVFGLRPSGTGNALVRTLLDRARAGVDIRVQVDSVGSWKVPAIWPGRAHREMVSTLRDAGIDVRVNKRIGPTDRFPAGPSVDHRKLVVVDDRVAYTGGINFACEFDDWHDVMARVEGSAAQRAGQLFDDRWHARTENTAMPVTPPGDAVAGTQMLGNIPTVELESTADIYERINAATDRIWVQTPFFSSPELANALGAAAGRGVDVRVLLPGKNEWYGAPVIRELSRLSWNRLGESGVRIYEQPEMSHAKVFLTDDVATVGSVNASRRSELWSHELTVVSDDDSFRSQVEELFERDLDRSTELTPREYASFGSRLRASVRDVLGIKY